MKKFLLATTSVLALAHAATAADLPARMPVKAPAPVLVPVATWTGFYLGIQGGVVSHRGRFDDSSPVDGVFQNGRDTQVGGTLGGYAGFNVQHGTLVFGLEADGSWVGAKATTTWSSVGPTAGSFDVRWLATARGRLGVAYDLTLFYVTGGAAFGNVKNSAQNPPGGIAILSESKTRVGWTVGGGIERRIASNWTMRGEVRYVDLGRSDTVCGGPFGCSQYSGTFKNSMIEGLVGVGLKF
jgi:outer membrane immunogenic protein